MNIALRYTAAGALFVATGAWAQTRVPEPALPAASASPLRYQSAFEGYRPLGNDSIGNWRAVNDRVREAAAKAAHGGHGAAAPRSDGMTAPPDQGGHHGLPTHGGAK